MKVSFHCPACIRNAFGNTRPRLCVVVMGFVALILHEMNVVVCAATPPTVRLPGMFTKPADVIVNAAALGRPIAKFPAPTLQALCPMTHTSPAFETLRLLLR